MKRVALLTIFFYVCTFASPQRAQAVVPVALIAAAAVGTAMMSASVGTYYAQNGVLPTYVSSTANAVASAADAFFQPSYLAKGVYHLFTPESLTTAKDYYIGKSAAVGAKLGDLVDLVKSSSSSLYSSLRQAIESNTGKSYDPTLETDAPVAGVFIDSDGLGWNVIGWEYMGVAYLNYPTSTWSGWLDLATIKASYTGCVAHLGRLITWVYLGPSGSGQAYHIYRSLLPSSTFNPDTVPPAPGALSYPALKSALAAPSEAVAKDVRDAIAALPDSKVIPAPAVPGTVAATGAAPSITAAELAAALQANTLAVANAVAEQAAAIAAANPDDAAAQIAAAQAAADAAKAAEEAAKEEPAEETFSPISDTAFAEPYNPGEFDIPARFTTFLNNVKASGLFSFSNDFFNSLPGGGSPVYEIEAGRYGHHSIDLSVTLSTGLAILKTILLACFGFLSIRAVIMKR